VNAAAQGGDVRTKRPIAGLILITLLAVCGCGGGSSSSGGGGGGSMNEVTWPSRDGGTTTMLPPAIETGRVVFQSAAGESCCVAVNPSLLSGSAQRGLAILNDLPVGPATVTVAGFTTMFAPIVPGIVDTCKTIPANAARDCDAVQVAAPAFESPPLAVTIIAGVQTNIGDVPMEAFPFLFDFSPAQDASAPAPVQFDLTVVDAVTNVRQDSVALEVSFSVPDENPEGGSPFRVLTKRVLLDLNACADGTSTPCSPQGNKQLAGFAATGTAPELPEGPVEAHITAENIADPPRGLDFRYSFIVLATPTATATATATTALEGASVGAGVSPAGARSTPTLALEASAGGLAGETPAATDAPSGAGGAPNAAIPPTPTATPAPGGGS
jgi:hypothetical protein